MKKRLLIFGLVSTQAFAQSQPSETPDRSEVKITGDSVKDSHQSLSSQCIEKFNRTDLSNTWPGSGFVLEIYSEAPGKFFNSLLRNHF